MNREELVAEIAKQTKLTQKSVGEVLTAIIDVTQDTVKKGEKVTLVGFGTFEPRKRAARNGRNPQTGETIKIEAKTVPTFSAGKKFKEIRENRRYYEAHPEIVEKILNEGSARAREEAQKVLKEVRKFVRMY